MLPANGIMQLCDNKAYLGKIFELDKEVVGFETIDEAIDLTRYYLAHDEERRQIAAAGWEKATKEYNEIAVFEKAVTAINRARGLGSKVPKTVTVRIQSAMRAKWLKTLPWRLGSTLKAVAGNSFKPHRRHKNAIQD